MKTLFDDVPDPPPAARRGRRRTIRERYEEFVESHPDVPALFEKLAGELLAAGRKRFGAKALVEVVRWHYATSTSGETPKLNDHFTAHLARDLIARRPEFDGFFELRKLRSE